MGLWLLAAALVTAPVAVQPATLLLGDPRIDVWNHAWGYFWVADALGAGRLPWQTTLVGGPAGGVLYFIDLLGAVVAAPLSALAGAAVGYNAVLIGRVALVGLGCQLLAEELWGRGPHTAVAGVAGLSMPFLLAELGNGISEVVGIGPVALALWAAARCARLGRARDAALAGLLVGWSGAVSFYYGLVSAVLVGLFLGATELSRLGSAPDRAAAARGALARLGALVAPAAAVALPFWWAFRASLAAPDALVRRPVALDLALLEHNAVDPRVFFTPGDFVSVDLAARYGEPFLHTGYLRLSVLALAALGLWRGVARAGRPRWPWAALALVSGIMGLGSYLWWDGAWVTLGGWTLALPFGVLKQALPQVAITHPLRLAVGAQVLLPALAAGGAAALLARAGGRLPGWVVAAGLGLLVAAEGLFGSAARWPLPTSSAAVPATYADLQGDGMVLDLPAEVGTGMATSRWFWFQTVHQRPVPWTPDVRLGAARDPELLRILARPGGGGPALEDPHPLDAGAVAHLRANYAAVVLHTDLAAEAGLSDYAAVLTEALGPPEREGPRLWWRRSSSATGAEGR